MLPRIHSPHDQFVIATVLLALTSTCHADTAATCASKAATHCPIKITNNSKAFTADQFYILAAAQDDSYVNPSTGKSCQGETAAALICPAAYLKFDKDGKGTLEKAVANGTSLPYAKRLSEFPSDPKLPNTYVLQMPRHGSGRIYLSLGSSITTSVVGSAAPYSISDPNISSPQDPNFYKLFDKFETSYLHKTVDEPLYINTTSVDFVSLPLSLSLEIPSGASKVVGYRKDRKTLFDTLTSKLTDGTTQEWQKLVQSFDGIPLRVIAPNKALQAPYDFASDYFQTYIQSVWDNFKKSTSSITITATEVLSDNDRAKGKTLTYTANVTDACSVETVAPTCGPYAGKTNVNNALCFKRDGSTSYDTAQPDTIPVAMPSGFDMIAADGTLCAPNKTARAIIARDLSALLNRGILPNAKAITLNDGDKSDKGFWAGVATQYYTSKAADGRPNFNLYSQVLHTLSTGGVYAFAFDDVGGADSTLVDSLATAAVVTIDDLSGTRIPNPEGANDGNTYNVTFGLPTGTLTLNDKTIKDGDYLTGLQAPFNLVWNGHRLAIYPKSGVISPAALGARSYNIAINPVPGDPQHLTLGFPAALPNPWPHSIPQVALEAAAARVGGNADLKLSITPNDYTGMNSEWFLVANNAKGDWGNWFYFDGVANVWRNATSFADLRPAYVGPLTTLSNTPFSIPGVPGGVTTFYVGVDTTVFDGTLDFGTLSIGSAEVTLK